MRFEGLDQAEYGAFFYNPSDGSEVALGSVSIGIDGKWQAPEFPVFRDWVIVLDRKARA